MNGRDAETQWLPKMLMLTKDGGTNTKQDIHTTTCKAQRPLQRRGRKNVRASELEDREKSCKMLSSKAQESH